MNRFRKASGYLALTIPLRSKLYHSHRLRLFQNLGMNAFPDDDVKLESKRRPRREKNEKLHIVEKRSEDIPKLCIRYPVHVLLLRNIELGGEIICEQTREKVNLFTWTLQSNNTKWATKSNPRLESTYFLAQFWRNRLSIINEARSTAIPRDGVAKLEHFSAEGITRNR